MHDYSDYTETPKNETARELSKLVIQYNDAVRQAEQAELDLKRARSKLAYLEEEKIPEALEALGTDLYRDPVSGLTIKIEPKIFASISQANQAAAYKWLDDNGHGGMIKRNIVVAFNRDQEKEAKELQGELRKEYPGVKEDCSVHNSTLRAWVKKQLKKGTELPDSISVERRPTAKITAGK